jgi:biopolymer transport protein TolQ
MQELLPLVAATTEPQSIWSLVQQTGLVVQLVILLLVAMSVVCWYIIAYKYLYLKRSARESKQFLDAFWRSRDIEQIYRQAQSLRRSPISTQFLAGYTELAKLTADEPRTAADREADLENIERSLRKAHTTETMKFERMTPVLATTATAAPFIGLFGTVWGIMNSFRAIDQTRTASIETIAPGIAEALLTTAIGLAAAVPAVIAYNYFQRMIRVMGSEMETFTQDYLNIIRRHFLK